MGAYRQDIDMSLATDIADAVWTYTTRTTDGQSVGASDGTVLDDVAYAMWTYATRTVDGGSTETPAAMMMAL